MTQGNQSSKPDLWGKPFPATCSVSTEPAPVVLLRQQADALTERTSGRVQGVVLRSFDNGKEFASLYAKVPALQGYMYQILTIAHPITDSPNDPSAMQGSHGLYGDSDWQKIDSMAHLTSWLQDALSSDQAHAVIVNLLTHIPEPATA